MGLRTITKGAVIASMMLSLPAYSAAAAPVSASPSTAVAADARTGAELEGESELGRGGFLIPLLALAAVILGLLVLLGDDEDEVSA